MLQELLDDATYLRGEVHRVDQLHFQVIGSPDEDSMRARQFADGDRSFIGQIPAFLRLVSRREPRLQAKHPLSHHRK